VPSARALAQTFWREPTEANTEAYLRESLRIRRETRRH